jgi:hypothetical protein
MHDLFTPLASDGRPIGCYVYMLLCQDDGPIYVKVGVANEPLKRLQGLLTACPVTPWQYATVRVRSRRRALELERNLLEVFRPWRARGEWLSLTPEEKPAFNAAWRRVFGVFSESGWRLQWEMLRVQPYLRKVNQLIHHRRRQFARAPRAERDARTDAGR